MKIKMPDGSSVDATSMDFKPVDENWNAYKLVDGTIVKVKTAVTKIWRLATTDPVTGQHHYFLQHETMVSVSEPEK